MTLALDFTDGEDLTLLVPVTLPTGERVQTERWPFNSVARELELLAEAAARGEVRASKAYQRIVWSLRRCKGERLLLAPHEPHDRDEECPPEG
jgi:hypothetical protein